MSEPPQEGNVPKDDMTIEQAARQAKAPAWAAAALKARKGWPIGKVVSLADYKKDLDALLKGDTEGGDA